MKAGFVIAVLAVLLVAMPLAAFAKEDPQYPEGKIKILGHNYSLAVRLGWSDFTNATARDTFGDGKFGFGVNLFRPQFKKGCRFDYDLSHGSHSKGDNDTRYIGATAGIHYNFVDPSERNTVPFAELHAGPYWAKTTDHKSIIVAGANATLGVELSRRVDISLHYTWMDKVNGFDLSHWGISVGVKVW